MSMFSENITPNAIERNYEIQDITLQYRISMDAIAPSQFVAIYNNGMTLGLKIHWKLSGTQNIFCVVLKEG